MTGANFLPIRLWWSFARLCVRCAHMRGIACLVVCAALAACGEDHSTAIKCGTGTSGSLSAGGSVEVTNGQDLTGAAIAADAHVTLPESSTTTGTSVGMAARQAGRSRASFKVRMTVVTSEVMDATPGRPRR